MANHSIIQQTILVRSLLMVQPLNPHNNHLKFFHHNLQIYRRCNSLLRPHINRRTNPLLNPAFNRQLKPLSSQLVNQPINQYYGRHVDLRNSRLHNLPHIEYPSSQLTYQHSRQPSIDPLTQPSTQPSDQPTELPSAQPSSMPTMLPTSQPLRTPSSHNSTVSLTHWWLNRP